MTEELLSCVEVEPTQEANASVIWLHGLGADGHDFEAIVPELKIPDELAVRFVFPHAPVRPVTMNIGMPMRAWFDVANLGPEHADDVEGAYASEQAVRQLIAKEKSRGIAANKIILAGFSQGGAIALMTGLRYPEKLAGIIALSTYLPSPEKVDLEHHPENQDTPILYGHGIHDPLVAISWGEQTRDVLQNMGYHIEWHSYPMEHCVCMEEIQHISKWITTCLR